MALELSAEQRALVHRLVEVLQKESAVSAIALGGSYARGHAKPGSDIDLVLYYAESAPLDTPRLGRLLQPLMPDAPPRFSALGEWGPWVNGGAWLRFAGQRVDVLYRSLDHVQRVLTDCAEGRWELHWAQQPPFGYFSPSFIEELGIGEPLFDRTRMLSHLRAKARVYPQALQQRIAQDMLWGAEFNLSAFAPKHAKDGDAFGFTACMARAGYQLTQVLFALNLCWPVPARIALERAARFDRTPDDFAVRLQGLLASTGASEEQQLLSLQRMHALCREVRTLCGSLYIPPFELP